MKRSISENIVVVTAIAIAVSLLASACGPGKMKTKLTKGTGINKIAGQDDEHTTETGTEISTDDKVLKAAQENRAASTNTTIEATAVEELASRMSFITLNDTGTAVSLTAQMRTKDQTPYAVAFSNGALEAQGNKQVINFAAAQAKKITGKGVADQNIVALPLSAKVLKVDSELSIVTISEKVGDKTTEVTAFVRVNDVEKAIDSKDENILKLKDEKISIRTTQLYLSDDDLLKKGELKLLNSRANRVKITIGESDESAIILDSKIDPSNKSIPLTIDPDQNTNSTINSENYDVTLEAANTIVQSDVLALKFKNKKTQEESNVTLNLIVKAVAAAAAVDAAADDSSKEESPASTEDSTTSQTQQATVQNKKTETKYNFDQLDPSAEENSHYVEQKTTAQKATEVAKYAANTPAGKAAIVTGAVLVAPVAGAAKLVAEHSIPAQVATQVVKGALKSDTFKQASATVGSVIHAVQKDSRAQKAQQVATQAAKVVAATPQAQGAKYLIENNPLVVGSKLAYTAGKTAVVVAVDQAHKRIPKTRTTVQVAKPTKQMKAPAAPVVKKADSTVIDLKK